ncbi:PHP domain-containing protein [Candidatus Woesearchaeota archaeon]|nr:PHP domain-containing protein [Candidatus Woesearchaeota archaeon]
MILMQWSKLFAHRVFFQDKALQDLKRDHMFIDMHTHTGYSHDSNTRVSSLLRTAKKEGIGLAVTDHLQVKGALEACKDRKVFVIPGIEIAAKENKEILLYFYSIKDLLDFHQKNIERRLTTHEYKHARFRNTIKSLKCTTPMIELLEQADEYNCVKCIPHPFSYLLRNSHKFFSQKDGKMKLIDAIEVVNSTMSPSRNKKAAKWGMKQKKAFTAGSDAHTAKELGKAMTATRASNIEEFLERIREKQGILLGKEMSRREAINHIIRLGLVKREKME